MDRTQGHLEGIRALRILVECSISFDIPYLTVFSFSSENWRRPKAEIDFIFKLLKKFVDSDLEKLITNNVKVRILGLREELSPSLQNIIARVEEKTSNNSGLNLNVAFNYGGRQEIASAVRKIGADLLAGKITINDIDEHLVEKSLFTCGIPDPDLLIRTGGEQRTSNFLLWQAAYSELVFLDVLWPDFNEKSFVEALDLFAARQRRFGRIETAT